MKTEPAVPPIGKILVIDDNPIIQRAVYFALRDKGYKILMCGEISGAVKIIREEKLDLILIDLSFPMDAMNLGGPLQDGFFVIDWIHRTLEIKKIPIIIISGSDPAEYKARADAAGVKACLKKPLNKEELLAICQSLLGGNTSTGQPTQS